jgi:PAS domain S-box-containing protein
MPIPLRVLLVEDSEDDARLVLRVLRRGGYDPVAERVDTEDALRAALARGGWDVVLSDHSMPKLTSHTALALAQETGNDLPFIIVSGSIGEAAVVAAMKAGAADYISKDNLSRLVPAIEREVREAGVRRERRRAIELGTRLSRILDTSPNEILVFDAESLRFVQLNEGARRKLGYATADLPRLTAPDVMPEFTEVRLRELVAPLRAGTVPQLVFETLHRRRDGQKYPVEVRLQYAPDEAPPVFVAIAQDITERKQGEAALQRMNSVLRATLESTADGILVVGRSGRVETFNRKFVEMWRLPEELVATRDEERWRNYVLDQLVDPQGWLAQIERLYREPEAEYVDVVEFKDGRVFERFSQPQRIGGESVGRVWSFRDVTARRRVEHERDALLEDLKRSLEDLSRAQQELVRRERLAALGELAAMVAHEVRNPLGVIFNSLSTLQKLVPAEGDAATLFRILGEEAERINRLVVDLLVFARPIQPVARPARLPDVVDEALSAAARAEHTSERVKLTRVADPALPLVPLDQQWLHLALVNLFTNSFQAMPDGGRLEVRVEHVERGGATWAQVSITDTGPGIPGEQYERIFEPFYTTKPRGTGLGLPIVKRIVEGHHGEVEVQSDGRRGTRFVIRLPCQPASTG